MMYKENDNNKNQNKKSQIHHNAQTTEIVISFSCHLIIVVVSFLITDIFITIMGCHLSICKMGPVHPWLTFFSFKLINDTYLA